MKSLKVIVILLMIITIFTETIIIKIMQKKINNLKIVTFENKSLKVLTPYKLNGEQFLFTTKFYDKLSKYHSPFNDGLTFKQLTKKYIRNKWTDYYGARRGYKNCRRVHEGIDLFVPENTPVFPIAEFGIVTFATDNPHFMYKVACKRQNGEIDSVKVEYGKVVRIVYPEGIESVYAHLNEVYVKTGDIVGKNTKVGITGVTGNLLRSGKPSHLHLELRDYKNRSFNPLERLNYDKVNVENFLKFVKLKTDS